MRYLLELPILAGDIPGDDDTIETALFAAADALHEWLAAQLRHPAELAALAAIDGACMLEARYDGWLGFAVADHWYVGALAAIHWFTLAAIRAPALVDAALLPAGVRVGAPTPETNWPPLLPVRGQLVTIRDGAAYDHDGLAPAPVDTAEAAAIAEAARTGRCRCSLCLPPAP